MYVYIYIIELFIRNGGINEHDSDKILDFRVCTEVYARPPPGESVRLERNPYFCHVRYFEKRLIDSRDNKRQRRVQYLSSCLKIDYRTHLIVQRAQRVIFVCVIFRV